MLDSVNTAFQNWFVLFLSLLVEAMPFLLLGVLFSGLLLLFADEQKLIALMPRNPALGALVGSATGFLFPVCECGNVPVARRFLIQGVPAPVAIGFLLAAPTVNPIVIWSTWVAFRDQPELVVLRVVCSLAIATSIGWIFSAQRDLKPLLNPALARMMPKAPAPAAAAPGAALLQGGTYWLGQSERPLETSPLGASALAGESALAMKDWRDRLPSFLDNTVREMRELGGVLVIGSAIAALIQVAVPREIIVSLGQGPISSILAMMLLATVISICSTVDAFFALSFSAAFTSGSLLAFLVFGPIIDLKAIGLMLTIFRPRAVAYLFVLAGQMSFFFALLVNYYLG